MPLYDVEVHVPCTAFAQVVADSPAQAVKKVNAGECSWPEDIPKPDWKGAEAVHVVDNATGEEFEV